MKRKCSTNENCHKKRKPLNILEKCEELLKSIKDDSDDYECVAGLADFNKLLNLFKRKIKSTELELQKSKMILPYCSIPIKKMDNDGDKRLKLFQDTLNNFHCTRSKLQEQFHVKFLQACLSHIYKDKYEQNRRRLYKEFRVNEISKEIFICAPRRFGKTWSISMFVAACLYCIPAINISVFSTGKRASSALRDFVLKFFTQLPGADDMIERVNQEVITVQPHGTQTLLERTNAFFYPSNVKTLKGVSAEIVILEEAAQLDLEVFYEVIVPLLGVGETSVLGISTPLDQNNFYSVLMNKCDPNTGRPLFETFKIQLLCESCRAANKFDCKHNLDKLPAWKPASGQRKVGILMESVPDLYQREVLGEVVNTTQDIFTKVSIDKLKAHKPVEHTPLIDPIIYTAIDPAGGGSGSDLAIVSFVRHEGIVKIIAMTSSPIRDSYQEKSALLNHFKVIRSIYNYSYKIKNVPTIVVIIESNMSWIISHRLRELVYNDPDVQRYCWFLIAKNQLESDRVDPYDEMNKKAAQVGIWTTRLTKESGSRKLSILLKHGCLKFGTDLSKIDKDNPSLMDVKIRKLLIAQLNNFKRNFKATRMDDLVHKPKTFISGKKSGADDLVMCLVFGLYWADIFDEDPAYAKIRNYFGLSY